MSQTSCDGCGKIIDRETALKEPCGSGCYDYFCKTCAKLSAWKREAMKDAFQRIEHQSLRKTINREE